MSSRNIDRKQPHEKFNASPGKKKKPHVAVDALSPSLKSSLSINDSTANPEVHDDDVSDMEYPNNNRFDYMSVADFVSGLSNELDNNIIGAEDMVVPSAMAKPSINTDEDIPDIDNVKDKAIFICEQFFVSTIFMNCVIKLVTAITEPNSFRKTLQDDTIGTVDLAYDVIKNPSKYKEKGQYYEGEFNKQNKDMGVIVIMSGSTAFSPDYLSSLSKKTNTDNIIQQPTACQTNDISNADIQHEQHNNNMNTNEQDEIPNEHYSKDYPNAGWRGYANTQWGGYLDNVSSSNTNSQLEEGKKSDYGDDVRWGTEVYLSSIEKEK